MEALEKLLESVVGRMGVLHLDWRYVVMWGVAFFFLYLAALSWSDLSFIMPLTAMSFFFASLTATFIPKGRFHRVAMGRHYHYYYWYKYTIA